MGTEAVSIVAAVLIAAGLLRSGELTLEGWLAFYMFLPRITGVMRQLSMSWITIKGVQGSAVRLGRIIDAPQEVLEQGKSVAAGSITLGGEDIGQMDLTEYRRRFAYVQQDAEVFSGTFRYILTYGVEKSVTDEDLARVTKLAGIYDFIIAQPDGLETKVAPWGASLSGGQRQCIAIARAIMHNPDYLLLDEATSALDARSRRLVADAFQNQMKDRTTVMIAHDLASIRGADNAIFIKDGKVEICGSPAEIIKTSEQYRRFVTKEGAAPAV